MATSEGNPEGKETDEIPTIMLRQPTLRLKATEEEMKELHDFLESNNLLELEPIFKREGITLEDILEMKDEEMKKIGIEKYRLRREVMEAANARKSGMTKRSSKVKFGEKEKLSKL